MPRAIALARGQAAALASMTDTCTIRRAGSASTDQSTGVRTPAYSTLYTGVCRVQQTLPISRPHDSGENFLLLARMDVQLPVSVTGLQVNDEVTVTAVGAGHDADLVGRVFLVRDLFHKSEPTARRVGVIERTAV
jgi:hypothetical protein